MLTPSALPSLPLPTPVVIDVEPSDFRLKEALKECPHFELSYHIVTKFLKEEAINELNTHPELLDGTRLLIIRTINNLYSFITKRNYQASEGQENFFHHIAGDANFEIATKRNIKGKNHSTKLAHLFNEVRNALNTLDNALSETTPPSEREIINKYQLKLQAHYNVLLYTLKKLPENKQQELKKTHKIVLSSSKLVYFEIAEHDQKAIQNLLVLTPSPKKPTATTTTPKKLKTPEKHSTQQARLLEQDTCNRLKLKKLFLALPSSGTPEPLSSKARPLTFSAPIPFNAGNSLSVINESEMAALTSKASNKVNS